MTPGAGTLARDSEAGRVKIADALARYAEHCRCTGTPFEYHGGNEILEVEAGELVGSVA